MIRILIADDERQITRVLRTSLQSSGYEVEVAANGVQAFEAFSQSRPDLIITDLVMPEMNGVELTQAVRKVSDVPIIVLSVRNQEATKIAALDEGADDYVTKPFHIGELMARIRANLRKTLRDEEESVDLNVGPVRINTDTRTVIVRGSEVRLTPKEFDLLLLLAKNPNKVMMHRTLLRSIWGDAGEDQPEYLRVLVAQLRKKIEAGAGPRLIESEPWVGYRLKVTADDPATY